jgi:outer membrane protein
MKHNKNLKLGGIALSLLLAGTAGSLSAQTVRKLSLSEAVELSLQNNKQIKLSNAKVEEAIASTRDMWNNHLPDFKISGSYLRLNNPDVILKVTLPSSSPNPGEHSSAVKVDQAAYGMATATLPVFAGFKIKYGVESARYLEQATKLDAENEKDDVVQNTVNAYSNLYKAQVTVDLVRENLNAQKQRVADFSNLERNGVMARNDLLKAQLQQSNIELTLLDAENNLKLASVNMDLMLGIDDNTILQPDSSSFQKTVDAGSVLNWEQTALHNRKDVEALSLREKAAYSGIKATKGDYYPAVALTGGTIALQVPNVITVTNALNGGIGLQYNLGSIWKTGAKVQVANAKLHQIQANESLIGDQVRVQVNQAFYNYLLATKRIDVYAKAIEQADENYRITKNKFDNSLTTTTELLDADVAKLQAQLNYAVSKADAAVAYKKLQQTAGVAAK